MGYSKAIISGNYLELYTYEKTLRDNAGKGRDHASRNGVSRKSSARIAQKRLLVQKRPDSAKRAELAFRRIILANMVVSPPPLLITCTYAKNQSDIREGYEDFRSFIGNLRYKFGAAFRYVAVPEFQRRGAIHFHALFWDLPQDLCQKERSTRLVANLWGRGFVDLYLTDGSQKLATYLGKYMSKSYLDLRLFGKKAYRCSKNILRPITEKGFGEAWYLNAQYGIGGVDNPPCVEKQFNTYWLGKGRYRAYNINPNNNGNKNNSNTSDSDLKTLPLPRV